MKCKVLIKRLYTSYFILSAKRVDLINSSSSYLFESAEAEEGFGVGLVATEFHEEHHRIFSVA